MAVIEEALVAYLTDSGETAGLIAARLYPLVIPQDVALPAVAYQRISGPRELAHDGPTGQANPRFQFTVTAESYAEAKDVANALRMDLDGWRGEMGDDGATVGVGLVAVENEVDGYDRTTDRVSVRLDCVVWHGE